MQLEYSNPTVISEALALAEKLEELYDRMHTALSINGFVDVELVQAFPA